MVFPGFGKPTGKARIPSQFHPHPSRVDWDNFKPGDIPELHNRSLSYPHDAQD